MNLNNTLQSTYTREPFSARQTQELAHLYSFGPVVFQVARLMKKKGILALLDKSSEGLTIAEIVQATQASEYAVKCLMEASLTMHLVLVNTETERYMLAKTGWFVLNDPMIGVDIDFNHDVNYEGWFLLDKALEEGRPAGLKHFGDWKTIYEGLSSLPKEVQQSWFGFDHYYSDHSFSEALQVIADAGCRNLLDVGGNTGRFAMRCVAENDDIHVTICDLPQQIEMMRQNIQGTKGANRIDGVGMDLLDSQASFPKDKHYDVIWMSQFLDCFSEEQVVSILRRAAQILDTDARIYIMETLWDRQKYPTAAFCLTQTSLYFTAMANGNSKMFHSDDLLRLVHQAGLEVERIIDEVGKGGHSILICRR